MTTTAPRHSAPSGTAGRGADDGWRPMDPMDCSWSGVTYVRSLVDIDMPPVDRIRRALWELSVESPQLGRWMSANPPCWRPVRDEERADWLARSLQVVDEPGADSARTFELNAEPLGDLAYRFLIGPTWISVRMTHAMGDGFTVNSVLGHLLRRAGSDTPVPLPWTTMAPRDRDKLIVKDVVRHPGALISAVRNRRDLAGGDYEPASREADSMTDLSVNVISRAGFTRELTGLRDARFAGASAAAVAMVGFRAAFAAVLPEPRPGFECLFNTRTKQTMTCWGNWSVGIYIRPTDDYSPAATTAEMSRVRDSGLPGIAAASLRARARRSNGDNVQVVAPEGAPRLTLSYSRAHAAAGMFPGMRDGVSSMGTLTRPNGIESLSISAVEVGDVLNVGLSFYPDVWSREAVVGAVETFLDDPSAVLLAHPRIAAARS